MNKKNIGSDFNDFLRNEGIYGEVHATALKEVFAAELRDAMKSAGLTEQALAVRMGSKGRNTVRRLLDPKNKSATLMVMVQAAHAAGLEMGLSFKKARKVRARRAKMIDHARAPSSRSTRAAIAVAGPGAELERSNRRGSAGAPGRPVARRASISPRARLLHSVA